MPELSICVAFVRVVICNVIFCHRGEPLVQRLHGATNEAGKICGGETLSPAIRKGRSIGCVCPMISIIIIY